MSPQSGRPLAIKQRSGPAPSDRSQGTATSRTRAVTSPHAGGGDADLGPDTADMLYCFISFSSGRRTRPGLRGWPCPVSTTAAYFYCFIFVFY